MRSRIIGVGITLWMRSTGVGGGGSGLLAAPATPTLTLISGVGDNQPDFLVSAAAADLPVGAVVTIYAYSDVGLTTLVDTGVGTVAVDGTITISNQLGPLADGTYWYNADTAIAGHATSAKSNTETNTIAISSDDDDYAAWLAAA